MRPLVLVAGAALVLALSATAGAKEPVKAELRGPAGCATVTDREDLQLVPLGGETTSAPPPLGAYHELVITLGTDTNAWWSVWYVDSAGVIAAPGESGSTIFMPVYGAAATFMKQLAKSVAPYPAPRITGAWVAGRRVAGDPASYAALFTAESTGSTRTAGGDWVPIELRSASRSPWTNGALSLRYSPGAGVLLRGPEAIRLEGSLAADVANARALGTGGEGGDLLPWLTAAALLVAILGLAGLGALLRRGPETTGAPEPTTA